MCLLDGVGGLLVDCCGKLLNCFGMQVDCCGKPLECFGLHMDCCGEFLGCFGELLECLGLQVNFSYIQFSSFHREIICKMSSSVCLLDGVGGLLMECCGELLECFGLQVD